MHGGLRTKLFGPKDYMIDEKVVGFHRIEAHEIDDIGVAGIVKRTLDVVGRNPVYLSIDIDGMYPFYFISQPLLVLSSGQDDSSYDAFRYSSHKYSITILTLRSPRSKHRTSNRNPRVRGLDDPRA